MHALHSTLAALSRALDLHRAAHVTKLQTSAHLFTPFAYVRKGECTVSRVIGDLLDPNGLHSQGPLFLEFFLDAFGFQFLRPVSAQARVATESPTGEGRRIDIVICDRTWIIGIENQPWAMDGELQVADYLKEIRTRGSASAYLIYLTKDGRRPSTSSINQRQCQRALARGDLRLASYQSILNWLDACHAGCRAERVRSFLSDFRQYLRGEIMSIRRLVPYSPVVDSLLAEDTREYLPAALEIAQHKDAIREALLEKLYAELRERLPHWGIKGTPMKADDGLALTPPNANDWLFCLEMESESRKWFYGLKLVKANGGRSRGLSALAERLRSRFRGSDGPNKHWLTWLWFDNRTAHDPVTYSQWEDNVQPWVDIANGAMSSNIASLAAELHDAAVELSNVDGASAKTDR